MNKNVYYDHEPAIYEAAGNGSYFYRWDIKKVEGSEGEGEGETYTAPLWECKETIIWAPVTREKITATVVATLWDRDYEAKLVNDYNAAKEGLMGDESQKYIDRYMDFLNERKAVKEDILQKTEGLI